MSLLLSLRSELLKTRRMAIVHVSLIMAAIIPLTSLLDYCLEEGQSTLQRDPWNLYLAAGFEPLNRLLLPLYVIMVCALLPQVDYPNPTWKQAPASSQLKRNVFVSKFLNVQLLILLFLLFYNLLMAATTITAGFITPGLRLFEHRIDWYALLNFNAKAYVSVLAMSTIQFWLGLRLNSFTAAVATGFCLWIAAGMLVFDLHVVHAHWFPFTYPILAVLGESKPPLPVLAWRSIGYTIFFLGLAFSEFSKRNARDARNMMQTRPLPDVAN